MGNSLSLTLWQTKILEIVISHLPNPGTRDSTSTVQSVLDEIQNTDPSDFSEFLDLETQLAARAAAHEFVQYVLTANQAALKPNFRYANPLERPLGMHDGYSTVLEFLSAKEETPFGLGTYAQRDENGNFIDVIRDGGTPLIDEFLWVFLHGARGTNLSSNGLAAPTVWGEMGKGYNNAQFNIRFKDEITEQETIEASDNIALLISIAVLKTALAGETVPSLFHLGQADGQLGAADLWFNRDEDNNEGYLRLGDNIGGWAGAPFFLLLRSPEFFLRDTLYYKSSADGNGLKDNYDAQSFSPTYDRDDILYKTATTYDLLAMAKAFIETGLSKRRVGGSAPFARVHPPPPPIKSHQTPLPPTRLTIPARPSHA